MSDIAFALLITAFAGLSTSLGGLFSLVLSAPGPRFMTFTLGFSGGVMVLVSFIELVPIAIDQIGFTLAHVAFFAGIAVMFLIDVGIPHTFGGEKHEGVSTREHKLLRTGLFVALGIGIHNFPEGMATFISTLADRQLGIALAVAIAIHNIPEGIAVSAPIYAATGSKKKAFWWTTLSGIAEPIGALLAALILLPILNDTVLAWMLSGVGGIMVYVALDELIPASREYGYEHLAIFGAVFGMFVMAMSLQLLR